MSRFTLPRDVYYGKGSLDVLKTIKGKKAMVVVGGGSMKRFGFLDKVCDNLKEVGMEVRLFEGVEPDPSVETVMKGRGRHAGVRTRLDRIHRRRFAHRRGQGYVGVL